MIDLNANTPPNLSQYIPVRLDSDAFEPRYSCRDWAYVDPSDKRLIDGLAAFEIGDSTDMLVYRVQNTLDGSVTLRCDNPKYADQRLSNVKAELYMVGRVVGLLECH